MYFFLKSATSPISECTLLGIPITCYCSGSFLGLFTIAITLMSMWINHCCWMCGTCAQSHDALLPTKLQAVSWGPIVTNFVPSEGSPYNGSIEKGASPGDHLAHPNSASFWKGPVQLHCPYGAASATVWQSFQRQVLIHIWLSSNIHSLWFWFLSSPPSNCFLSSDITDLSFCSVHPWHVSFQTPAAESYI